MLRSLKEILRYKIEATDGQIGDVNDFYFDDCEWIVRYLIDDTGRWLPGRKVLISPISIEAIDWAKAAVRVNLTKEQVQNSPEVGEHKPVSRQLEDKVVNHYRWPVYWGGIPMTTPVPVTHKPPKNDEVERSIEDPCLRSLREVTGYDIKAEDGEIGHVEDMIFDDETWRIRYAVIDTSKWIISGKKVLIALEWIDEINWQDSNVTVELSGDLIKNSPPFDPSEPVNRVYEETLYDYYGRPKYWEQRGEPVEQ